MDVVIFCKSKIPVKKYGGTERVVYWLGEELANQGHKVSFLTHPESSSNFAKIIPYNENEPLANQIPECTDVFHSFENFHEEITKPFIITMEGNPHEEEVLSKNMVFVSKNHAKRYNSEAFVYNGIKLDEYKGVDLNSKRDYFHFLAKAAWKVKNVKGAIKIVTDAGEKLKVLGGTRLNFNMGFRFTPNLNVSFAGMVGGDYKNELISKSKGLIFPVQWNEPFGIAIIESMYYGCPVFGTPYGSLPELIHKDVGCVSNSSNELTNAIKNIDAYSRKVCHEYVADEFNIKVMTNKYITLYEKVLNNQSLNTKQPYKLDKNEPKLLDFN